MSIPCLEALFNFDSNANNFWNISIDIFSRYICIHTLCICKYQWTFKSHVQVFIFGRYICSFTFILSYLSITAEIFQVKTSNLTDIHLCSVDLHILAVVLVFYLFSWFCEVTISACTVRLWHHHHNCCHFYHLCTVLLMTWLTSVSLYVAYFPNTYTSNNLTVAYMLMLEAFLFRVHS